MSLILAEIKDAKDWQMIYSIKNDFVFIHCPRTSGTAITSALKVLIPDAVEDLTLKHITWIQLPEALKRLRAFTVMRPYDEIRRSYHRLTSEWMQLVDPETTLATIWWIEHAKRVSMMTLEEYLESDEPPLPVDGYKYGMTEVFQYHENPYGAIAEFCRVDESKFIKLMDVFR